MTGKLEVISGRKPTYREGKRYNRGPPVSAATDCPPTTNESCLNSGLYCAAFRTSAGNTLRTKTHPNVYTDVNPGSGIKAISTAKIPFHVTDNLYRGNRKRILVSCKKIFRTKETGIIPALNLYSRILYP